MALHEAQGSWSIAKDYAMCRLRGHHWELQKADSWLVVHDGYLVWHYACGDCGTTKQQPISYRTGGIRSAQYRHPDGYLLSLQDQERPSRADLRLECVHVLTRARQIRVQNGK